ncbi:MAG: endonuclease/exonuclease/phosphatase family protein, partial [Planctomycetota bacterium]
MRSKLARRLDHQKTKLFTSGFPDRAIDIRPSNATRRKWMFEELEPRLLLTAMRLVAWNTFNNPNDAVDDASVRTVLEAIGTESVQGNAGPVDVLALQETDPPSIARLEAILDNLYTDDYSSVVSTLDGGGDATGFIYNTSTINLLDSIELTGPLTHHTIRARFEYVDDDDSVEFYAYTVHLRSGVSSESRSQRALEADYLRSDIETLGAGANVLFVGDFNLSGSSESAFAEITTAGEAQVLDVANAPGEWSDNPAFIELHSQNSSNVRSRLDLQFASEELFDGTGLDYVENSYRVFGNNGSHTLNQPISTGTDQSSAVLAALEMASDHLPIVADYEIINDLPAIELVETQSSTSVVENGRNDTYSIVLNTIPTDDVLVTLSPGPELDIGNGAGIPITLIFTPINALTPQTIIVSATDDADLEGTHLDEISHSVNSLDVVYADIIIGPVNVEIRDDDAPDFIINELDSDTVGTDQLEFIEIYDGGVGNVPLDALALVFFNGFNDSSYFTLDLDGFSTGPDGLFVAGNAGVANVDAVFANGELQNGADAVALYRADATDFPNGSPISLTDLLDAIIYDTDDADDLGLASLLLPSQPQLNEDENNNQVFESLARVPDGGPQRTTNRYQALSPTPGLVNTNPVPGVDLVQSGSGTDVSEAGITDS